MVGCGGQQACSPFQQPCQQTVGRREFIRATGNKITADMPALTDTAVPSHRHTTHTHPSLKTSFFHGQTADLHQLIRLPHAACHSWHGAGKGECCKTPVQRQGTALVRSSAEDTTQAVDIVHAFERTAPTVKVTSEACKPPLRILFTKFGVNNKRESK